MKKTYLRCKRWCTNLLLMFSALAFSFTVNAQCTDTTGAPIPPGEIQIDGNSCDWADLLHISNPTYSHVEDAWNESTIYDLDNQFTKGSSDANFKAWSDSQVKNKNDIVNSAAVLVNDTLYFAGDRYTVEGDAQIGFWFFHNGTAAVKDNPTDKFGYFYPNRIIGDLLILADFTGGGRNANVTVLVVTAVDVDGVVTLSQVIGVTSAVVAENNDGAKPVPAGWNYGTPDYPQNAFYEGQIDLGELQQILINDGIIPDEGGNIDLCYSGFLLETRSSQSITASLDDFVNGSFTTIPNDQELEGFVSCDNEEASLTGYVTMLGSETGVSYQLYDSGDNPVGSPVAGTGDEIIWSSLPDGDYHVMASNTLNCTAGPFGPVTVMIYDLPSCGLTADSIVSSTNYANSNGEIHATATAGDGGSLSYSWTKDGDPYPDGDGLLELTGLSDGEYCLTVSEDHGDGNICVHVCCFTVQWLPSAPTCNITPTDAACFDSNTGSIDITDLTGVGDFAVDLQLQKVGGGDSVSVYSNTLAAGNLPVSVDNLHAGVYILYVTDNGNTETDNQSQCDATISEPTEVTLSISATDVSCNGEADGMISIDSYNGDGTPTFYLDNVLSSEAAIESGSYGPGKYFVKVTYPALSGGGVCEAVDSVVIAEPTLVTLSISGTDVSCNGEADGMISIDSYNGDGTPTFYLDNVLSSEAAIESGSYGPGKYFVKVTYPALSGGGVCEAVDSVVIAEPTLVTLSISGTDVSCNGEADGMISIDSYNGDGTPTFYLDNVLSSEAAIESGSYGPGKYFVKVTYPALSGGGVCEAVDSVVIAEPTLVTLSISGTDVSCNGEADGMISIDSYNGDGTPTFYLDNVLSSEAAIESGSYGPGKYFVKITYPALSGGGVCEAVDSVVIAEPTLVTLSISGTDVSCNGEADGMISIDSYNGDGTPTFYLDNVLSSEAAIESGSYGPGKYFVKVTYPALSGGGVCEAVDSVVIAEPTLVTLSISGTDVSCNGEADGMISIDSYNGDGTPTFYLDNVLSSEAAIESGSYGPGKYFVKVTYPALSGGGVCEAVDSVVIAEPTLVTLSISGTDVSCNGEADGMISIDSYNGDGTPTFYLDNVLSSEAAIESGSYGPGKYFVKVTYPALSGGGVCEAVDSVVIAEPTLVTLSISGTDVSCNGEADGMISIDSYNGDGTPTFYLDNVLSSEAAIESGSYGPGKYFVKVTYPALSGGGVCEAVDSVVIAEPTLVTLSISGTDVSCNGEADGMISIDSYNGDGTPTFYLDNVLSSEAAIESGSYGPGKYFVKVTYPALSGGGVCEAVDSVTITEPPQLICNVLDSADAYCNDNTGWAIIDITGGTPGSGNDSLYWYSMDSIPVNPVNWIGVSTFPLAISDLAAGSHTIYVMDDAGCTSTCDVTIGFTACPSETAFAKGDVCFLTEGFNRWGWRTEFAQQSLGDDPYEMELWMGAGQCDTTKGTLVGSVFVSYIGDEVTVMYVMDPGFSLTSVHTYVGCDGQPYPLKKGVQTVAPGQYNYGSPSLDYVSTVTVTFITDGSGDPVNVIAHAMASEAPGDGDYVAPDQTVTCGSNSKSAEIISPAFNTSELKVYPNPFNDKLRFEFSAPVDTHARIDLYDVTGKMVKTIFDNFVAGDTKYNAEFKPVNDVSGMYFYRVTMGDSVYNGKVIYKK